MRFVIRRSLAAALSICATSLLVALAGCSGGTSSTSTAPPANAATTTTLALSANAILVGSSVTLTATTTSPSGTPNGSVTFYDGATSLGYATLSGTTATLATSSLAAGSHSLSASYAGTTGFQASSSAAVTLTVTAPQSTTTTVSASPNPVTQGNTATVTATVTASSGTPTGTVTFADSGTTLGTGTLSNGVATYTTSTLAVGAHSLTASYAGATGYKGSTSSAYTLNVQAAVPVNAHGTLSFSSANQTITGFGGAEAFYVSYLDGHPYQNEIYNALFDPTNGLGLTYLRVQNSYYLYNGSNGSSFDTDTPKVITAANAAHGSPLTILMSSWTPPAALKSNNSVNNGGTLNMVGGSYNYAGFAQFWYNSLLAYSALGVNPDYISIQNEPDYTATYVSCRFNPTEATYNGTNYAGYGLAFDAVYKQIQSLAKPPKMVGPETFSAVNFLDMAAQIPTSEVSAYAHHLYNVSSITQNPDQGLTALRNLNAAYPTQPKFETEYYAGPGFLNAWHIHNALTVANDNAYIYWGLAWPSTTLSNGQAQDQAGLLYLDNPFNSQSTWAFSHGWSYNDAYYAMKHYSYFIRPGYVRYNATLDNTDERLSVYQSADKKTTVLVALNTSTTATDGIALDLSGVTYTKSAMYRSTFSAPIATGERWASLGAVTPAGISLPPQSVVTIVLSN